MTTGEAAPAVSDELVRTLIAEQQRAWRRLLALPRVLESAYRTKAGSTPYDVVLEQGSHRLLRYRGATAPVYAEPVLFCYALINRPYILDLEPDKSVIRRYLERGFDVYLIDWGTPSEADHVFTIGTYVSGFLREAVDFLRPRSPSARLHLIGYCMGGTLAAVFAALEPDPVQTLTLLAAPIDFVHRESLLNVWSDPRVFDVDAFVDAHGNCPAWFLQACFLSMNPVQNLLGKHIGLCEQLDDPRAVSSYFAMERWVNDNIPVAGETFRQFVKNLYQQNQLVSGRLRIGEERVALERIECPLLLLTAAKDHLVPQASTEGIRPHVRSREIESMSTGAGHVGLVVGGRAQKTLWPRATDWLARRSTQVSAGAEAHPARIDRDNGGS